MLNDRETRGDTEAERMGLESLERMVGAGAAALLRRIDIDAAIFVLQEKRLTMLLGFLIGL